MTRDDLERNGNLLCTIRLIQFAPGQFYAQQLAWMGVAVKRQRVIKALTLCGDEGTPSVAACAPPCGPPDE